ncbi:MAG: AI-2E family transporter, partial [Planctomycetota bacterium]|nr:AI-2E family transporter [Planctomycetota bacterium]
MQPVRDVLVGLAIFGLLYLGYVLSVVTVPLLLALALAYLLEPVVKWLARRRWISRQGAAAGLIGAVALL